MSARRHHRLGLLALAMAGLSAPIGQALALSNDQITVYAEDRVTSDSNVFRLPGNLAPPASSGSTDRGDTYNTLSLGVDFDIPVSLQRFQGGVRLNQTRYQRHSSLNFSGHDARAAWLWQIGSAFSGQVGITNNEFLAPFSDVPGSTVADRIRQSDVYLNGGYNIGPRLRIQAGTRAFTQRNSDPGRAFNDVDVANGTLSLRYTTAANSWVGLNLESESGRFPNLQPVSGVLVSNNYRQTRAGIEADWTITGVSRLNGRIDQVNRRYEQLSGRNFSGATAHVEYEWKPTGKLTLVGAAQRDISPYEYLRSSMVLVRGVSIRPTLNLTAKTDLTGIVDYNVRSYLTDAATIAVGGTGGRQDTTRTVGVGVNYQATRTIRIQANVQRERRTSNVAFGDYSANVFWLSGRVAF